MRTPRLCRRPKYNRQPLGLSSRRTPSRKEDTCRRIKTELLPSRFGYLQGQSPAIGVAYGVECGPAIDGWQDRARKELDKYYPYAFIGTLSDKDEKEVGCIGPVSFEPIGDSAGAAVRLSYSDVFSNQYQITYFFFADLVTQGVHIGLKGPPEIRITHAEISLNM